MVWIMEKMEGWIAGCNWLSRVSVSSLVDFHGLVLKGAG